MSHLHHVVLFTLNRDADIDAAMDVLDASRPASGLISWSVKQSIDERKGRVIAEVAVFEDEKAFEAFRGSPTHRSAGEHMAMLSDWVVADWTD